MLAPLKLRTQLAVSYAVLFAILLGAVGVAVYHVMALRLKAEADDNLTDHLAGVWGYISFQTGKPVVVYDTANPHLKYFLDDATRYYQLYDVSNGELLLESADSSMMHLALPPLQARRLVSGVENSVAGQNGRLRFRSGLFQAKGRSYLLRVGLSTEQDVEDLRELRKVLLWLLPITTVIASFVAWWMAGRALGPLRQLENEARSIGITQLNRRLPLRGTHDELDSLAATFNQVFARLDAGFEHMKRFTAYMSHELRTPLTVLRGEAEVSLMHPARMIPPKNWRDLLSSQLEEYDKLDRLIRRFLLLARAEAGEIELDSEEFNVCDLAAVLGNEMTPVAANRGVSLKIACKTWACVVGDRGWIERAILNLLDNAIKYTPPGGTVQLTASAVAGRAVIEVSDTGRGIAETDLPLVFDCFYRGRGSQPKRPAGIGLGLALTKWVVEKHGGEIRVKSTVGQGAVFTILLPLVAEPAPVPAEQGQPALKAD